MRLNAAAMDKEIDCSGFGQGRLLQRGSDGL
jgi:hypothetical protein